MGYSLIATTGIFLLTFAIAFQISFDQLYPTLLNTHTTFTNTHIRDIKKLNTNIQITNVTTNWWDSQWEYRKLITLNSSQITDEFTNFTILIDTTDTDLRDNAQSNGNDITFINYNGTEQYNHELERYDNSNGQLTAWVKIPTLPATEDTLIYMYYGNPTAPNQQNPTKTWDINYIAVWHFHNNSLADTTTNNYNGTNSGTSYTTTSKIAGGREYTGDDYIDITNFAHLPTTLTAEAWVFRDNSDTANFIRIFNEGPSWDDCDWSLYWRTADTTMRFIINNNDYQEGGTYNKKNDWFHIAITYDTGDAILYNDGTLEEDWTSQYGASIANAYSTLTLGNQNGGGRGWDGKLDEIRISNITRSDDWIQTSYNTMNSPSTFTNIGTQQSITTNEIDLTIIVENTGKNILTTNDFSVLINGKISQFTCPHNYLEAYNNVTITAPGLITGTDRIKIITPEGITDYYIFIS